INLDMTILGGFAYVHSNDQHTYEIAYLNAVNNGSCHVEKTEAMLRVLEGTITTASTATPISPGSNAFDLDGAVVTFDGPFSTSQATGNGPGPLGGSDHPANPDDPLQWQDLKYVPNVTHAFPGAHLDAATWRTKQLNGQPLVNGRVVLTSGNLKATKPTEPAVVRTLWNFKKRGPTGAGNPVVFAQSMTNETLYSTQVTS